MAAGSARLLYTRWSTGSTSTRYLTSDHLNSSTVVMNNAGTTLVNLGFGALGARRGAAWSGSPSAGDWTQINNATRRGYTGHEHLDNVNLIHMNGRVYEPVLGRFLSADPFIDGIFHSQGPNRFAYVRGNPLTFSDPTGWSTDDDKTTDQWINKNELAKLNPIEVFGQRFDFARDFAFQNQVWLAGFRQFPIGGESHTILETISVTGQRVKPVTAVSGSGAAQAGERAPQEQEPDRCNENMGSLQVSFGGDAKFFSFGKDAAGGPGINTAGQVFWQGTEGTVEEGYGAALVAGPSVSLSLSDSVLPFGLSPNFEQGGFWEFHAAFLLGGGFRVEWSPGSSSTSVGLKGEIGFAFFIGTGKTDNSVMATDAVLCGP